jgi:hypothetical protein
MTFWSVVALATTLASLAATRLHPPALPESSGVHQVTTAGQLRGLEQELV